MTTVLAIDPGGSTGLAIMSTEDPKVFRGDQLIEEEHFLDLLDALDQISPDVIVCEDFEYRVHLTDDGKPIPGIEMISRDYIGVIRLWIQFVKENTNIEVPLFMQKPNQVRSKNSFWFDPEKLKGMGLYKENAPHQNDAMRHLLYYLTFTCTIKTYFDYLRDNESCTLGPIFESE